MYCIFFYLSMYCTFPVVIFVRRNIAVYSICQNLDVLSVYIESIISRAFFNHLLIQCDMAIGLVVRASVSQARFRILHSAFFIFFFFPEFSSTSLKVTRILQYMDCKNGAGKFPSIYLLHCYPTVHLPDLSCKLKTVRNRNWFVRFHINNSND